MKKVIVMDLDGTWVDVRHLQGFLRSKPKNWRAFNAGIVTAPPIITNEEILYSLLAAGHDFVVGTARMEDLRQVSMNWVRNRNPIKEPLAYFMRGKNDYREDVVVKLEMLGHMRQAGFDPWVWYDDKRTVCEALRKRGVAVHQVATCTYPREEESDEQTDK